MTANVRIELVNWKLAAHAQAAVDLLDTYARDPMGGGTPLQPNVRDALAREMAQRPHIFSVLAFAGPDHGLAVGLVNCIEGFSTFACKPLVNVHDVVVLPAWRGQGIAAHMLDVAQRLARERGACKMTLEVLPGNLGAVRLYERLGYAGYTLDPAMGQAIFMQKWLD